MLRWNRITFKTLFMVLSYCSRMGRLQSRWLTWWSKRPLPHCWRRPCCSPRRCILKFKPRNFQNGISTSIPVLWIHFKDASCRPIPRRIVSHITVPSMEDTVVKCWIHRLLSSWPSIQFYQTNSCQWLYCNHTHRLVQKTMMIYLSSLQFEKRSTLVPRMHHWLRISLKRYWRTIVYPRTCNAPIASATRRAPIAPSARLCARATARLSARFLSMTSLSPRNWLSLHQNLQEIRIGWCHALSIKRGLKKSLRTSIPTCQDWLNPSSSRDGNTSFTMTRWRETFWRNTFHQKFFKLMMLCDQAPSRRISFDIVSSSSMVVSMPTWMSCWNQISMRLLDPTLGSWFLLMNLERYVRLILLYYVLFLSHHSCCSARWQAHVSLEWFHRCCSRSSLFGTSHWNGGQQCPQPLHVGRCRCNLLS